MRPQRRQEGSSVSAFLMDAKKGETDLTKLLDLKGFAL
jgi:hypothetical protein